MSTTTYTPREFAVSILHHDGKNRDLLTDSEKASCRLLADGFGDLRDRWAACDTNDDQTREQLLDMVWDWSHVRDSSELAFDAMQAYALQRMGMADSVRGMIRTEGS